MKKSGVLSPARSQGPPETPRRRRPRRSCSLGSPGPSKTSDRPATALDHFKEHNRISLRLSPLSKTILNDNTDIEEPRRNSWWKKIDDSRDISSTVGVLEEDRNKVKAMETNILNDEFEIEVLSQERKDYTFDLPESSGSESIGSIVIPQRKLLNCNDNAKQLTNSKPTDKLHQLRRSINLPESSGNESIDSIIIPQRKLLNYNDENNEPKNSKPKDMVHKFTSKRESPGKHNKTDVHDETVNVGARKLFNQEPKRSKPTIPAALLVISPDKTVTNKTKELVTEIKGQARSLFGNRPATKRKNMFVNFIESESEDEISEIQPKLFTFDKVPEPVHRRSSTTRSVGDRVRSSINSTDLEMEDWNLLPSSTMVEHQLEAMVAPTPAKKTMLSKVSETKESEAGTKSNITDSKTNQFNNSISSKDKSNSSPNRVAKEKTGNKSPKKKQIDTNAANQNTTLDKSKANSSQKTNTVNKNEIKETPVKEKNQNVVNKFVEESEKDIENAQEIEKNYNYKHDQQLEDNEISIQKLDTSSKGMNEKVGANEQEMEKGENNEIEGSNNQEDGIESNEEMETNHCEQESRYMEDDEIEYNDEENDEEKVIEEQDDNELRSESQEVDHDAVESENEEIFENQDDEVNQSQEVQDDEENPEIAQGTSNEYEEDAPDEEEEENEENQDDEVNQSQEVQDDEENPEIAQDTSNEYEEDAPGEEEDIEENQDDEVNHSQEVQDDEENPEIAQDNSNEYEEDAPGEEEEDIEEQEESEEIFNEEDGDLGDQDVSESKEQDEETEEVRLISEPEEIPNKSHDTTGRHRRKDINSPEAILHDVTNHNESFTAKGRNTSNRKSTILKNFFVRHSMDPPKDSTGLSDGTKNSSAEGSGWDSHRTTRKTLRQTFGRDFTPRKSLRALVMEKSAKRQTAINEANAKLNLPQANSTEMPGNAPQDDDMEMDYEENNEMVQESDHDMSTRTRQLAVEMYMEKMKKETIEYKRRIDEQVRNSLKVQPPKEDYLNRMPAVRRKNAKSQQTAPKAKKASRFKIPLEYLPEELLEDLKYKPPKRFKGRGASWTSKRLYNFLESKLGPKYDYKARVRAEKLVEKLYNFTRDIHKQQVAPAAAVAEVKHEMARLNVVRTHFEFYEFIRNYLPLEIKHKIVPDIVNDIPLPRNGVFADILTGETLENLDEP